MPRKSTAHKQQSIAETKFEQVLNRLPHEKVRCVDVETSGLNWRRQHIVGYVLSFGPGPADSYYLPFRHKAGGNLFDLRGPQTDTGWDGKPHKAERELVKLIDQPGTLVFGHNLHFDLRFLSRVGYSWQPRHEDTMINAALLDEYQRSYSLEGCANIAKVEAKKSQQIVDYLIARFPEIAAKPREAMGHYWRLAGDDATAVEYAEGDGVSTWQLREWQMQALYSQSKGQAEKTLGDLSLVDVDWKHFPCLLRVHDIESRLIPILSRMMVRGIKVDEERLLWLRDHVEGRIQQLCAKFPADFNVRSPNDVEKWCTDHGQTDWPFTKPSRTFPGGKASFPESWLETFEAGQQIVSVRKLETLLSTFIMPLQTTHVFNGRVHTEFNQLRGDEYGTITGRLSSSNPNLQAVPKHNEMIGRLFRSVFVPDTGKIWGEADWSQMEPRLLAFYSRCKVLMDGYRADPPIDAHTSASMAANRNWPTMSDKERKAYRDNIGKRINQTIITGGGRNVLVSKYKVPAGEVDRVWNDYFRAMPEIRTLQKHAAARMEINGYVHSLLGRKARLQYRDRSYTAVNRLLQCGNADAIKLKMVEIGEYLKTQKGTSVELLMNCHDALTHQFEEDDRQTYEHCLHIMQDFGPESMMPLDVPIVVDAGEGPSWAIATYGEEK